MDTQKINPTLGTKWFTFYTKVRPWFACFMVFSVISDFVQYPSAYMNNWWLLLYFLAAIAQPILGIIVFIKSSGDYVSLVRFVKGVLLFETINIAYQQGVKHYINNGFDIKMALIMFAIIFVFMYFVWYRLNVKYFEKRIGVISGDYLEDDPNRVTECISCGYRNRDYFDVCPQCGKHAKRYVYLNEEPSTGSDPTLFCRNCGEKLAVDSRFCNKCGAKVAHE